MKQINIFYGLPAKADGGADVVLSTVIPDSHITIFTSRDLLTGKEIYHGVGVLLTCINDSKDSEILFLSRIYKQLDTDKDIQRLIREFKNTLRFNGLKDYIADLEILGFIK